MTALCLLGFFAFAVLDWVAVAQEWRQGEHVAKPAALAFLLLFAALGPAASWALLAALAFCLLGDVYLMLEDELFPAGVAAFAVGHFAYVGAFTAGPWARLIWFAIVTAASAPIALRVLRSVPAGPLRAGIGVYMTAISLMVGSALASGSLLAAAGALLFFASDSLIGLNRFVAPIRNAPIAIIVTYHVGQFLIVLAVRG